VKLSIGKARTVEELTAYYAYTTGFQSKSNKQEEEAWTMSRDVYIDGYTTRQERNMRHVGPAEMIID
jgi:hypothetical protein